MAEMPLWLMSRRGRRTRAVAAAILRAVLAAQPELWSDVVSQVATAAVHQSVMSMCHLA